MEQTGGILILVKRDTDGGGFDVAFGMRSHNDIPDTSCAVGNREFLETLGLKIVGDTASINGEDVFKEWLIQAPFQQVLQELGDASLGFEAIPHNELAAAWKAFSGDLGKGIKAVWRGISDISWFLLLYDSASYKGGIKADDSTSGSIFYALAAINSGLYWQTPKLTQPAINPKEIATDEVSKSAWLQRLADRYPEVATKLIDRVRSGGVISGEIDDVACNIWWLGQLWLVFLDGDDFGLTHDREIYDHIRESAAKRPKCSMEDEASAWMHAYAADMSIFEIRLGLDCAVKSVGTVLIFNGNYDETFEWLVSGTDRSDISD